jgi:hypothetical protein
MRFEDHLDALVLFVTECLVASGCFVERNPMGYDKAAINLPWEMN